VTYDHNKSMVACGRREALPLLGATVKDVVVEGGFLGLVFRCVDGRERTTRVMRDPEGNGPGWLEIDLLAADPKVAKLKYPTRTEIRARMRDPRFQITGKDPCDEATSAPCIVCERVDCHVDGGGSHYTCSGMVGRKEHLYYYCVDSAGCSGNDSANKAQVSARHAGKDHSGAASEHGGLFVVWRCPCDGLSPRYGWKPSMGAECPVYGSAYDVVGDVCHVCKKRRGDPKRAKAGRAD
jgi:hypothetical protein